MATTFGVPSLIMGLFAAVLLVWRPNAVHLAVAIAAIGISILAFFIGLAQTL